MSIFYITGKSQVWDLINNLTMNSLTSKEKSDMTAGTLRPTFIWGSSLFVQKLSILKSWFLLRNRPVTLSKSRKRQHRSSSFEGDSTASLGTRHYYGLYPETKHIKMQWNDPATMAYSLKQLPVKHKKMQWNDSATIAYTRKQNLERCCLYPGTI